MTSIGSRWRGCPEAKTIDSRDGSWRTRKAQHAWRMALRGVERTLLRFIYRSRRDYGVLLLAIVPFGTIVLARIFYSRIWPSLSRARIPHSDSRYESQPGIDAVADRGQRITLVCHWHIRQYINIYYAPPTHRRPRDSLNVDKWRASPPLQGFSLRQTLCSSLQLVFDVLAYFPGPS